MAWRSISSIASHSRNSAVETCALACSASSAKRINGCQSHEISSSEWLTLGKLTCSPAQFKNPMMSPLSTSLES